MLSIRDKKHKRRIEMLIRMLSNASGPTGNYAAGQELETGIDISQKAAQGFIDHGNAEIIQKRTEAKKGLYEVLQESKAKQLNDLENRRGKNQLIQMVNQAAGPEGSFQAGEQLEIGRDVSREQAQAFLKDGFAIPILSRTKLPIKKHPEEAVKVELNLIKKTAGGPGKIIKMRQTAAGPDGAYQEGQELEIGLDISPELAQTFLDSQNAKEIKRKSAIPGKFHRVEIYVYESDVMAAAENDINTRSDRRWRIFLKPEAIQGIYDGERYTPLNTGRTKRKEAEDGQKD
jgi:hypothetical protein